MNKLINNLRVIQNVANYSIFWILILLTANVKCQIMGKEEYLKSIQAQNPDFECLKKCVRPPSVNLNIEPSYSEKDPRPTASNCNDRAFEECKKVINSGNTPLTAVDETKVFFSKSTQTVTWHAAWRSCRAANLQLVSVFSENFAKKLAETMVKEKLITTSYWSSGYVLSSGEMVWLENGNPIVWATMMPGAPPPKKASNTCISITFDASAKKIKLNEEACSKILPYICEVPDECFTQRCV